MNTPKILEVTLRDGSYAIDFQFTSRDTALISKALEDAGFEMIEVGHGVGLGASRAGKGRAAETDEAYMQATADSLETAQWGMFCIPGIATLEDVDLAASFGMDFIRIGTNVTETEDSEPFIERARKHGMFVCANFMKSYTMPPKQFGEKAKLSQKFGSQLLYIVDSAGGMLSDELESYFRAVQDACDIDIGFHGHNNLSLAVANSLKALEMGAVIIDVSLQGIGRSSGNTPTEVFLAVLERMGIQTGFDMIQVMDIGEKYIKPLLLRTGYPSIDTVTGFSGFHSSYMGVIREYADKHEVDPRRLIMAVCQEDRINASRDLVERAAVRIREADDSESFTAQFRLDRYPGGEQEITRKES